MEMITYLIPAVALFLGIFLPPGAVICSLGLIVLMLLPTSAIIVFPHFPDIKLFTAVVIPLFFVTLIKRGGRWNFSIVDPLILFYVAAAVISQYKSPYSEFTINHAGLMTFQVAMAYGLFKMVFYDGKYVPTFFRRFVYCVLFVLVLGVWELRMTDNLFDDLGGALSQMPYSGKPTFRFGLVRLKGSFGHPIIAAMIIALAIIFLRFLSKSKSIESRFALLPVNKVWFLAAVLLVGLLLPLSRGPVFALFLAFFAASTIKGRSLNLSFALKLFVSLVTLFAGYLYYSSQVSEKKDFAFQDQLTASAMARQNVFNAFLPAVNKNLFWGEGYSESAGMQDEGDRLIIDNHYIHLMIKRGVFAFSAFIAILLLQLKRLMKREKQLRKKYPIDSQLSYTYLIALLMIAASIWNVVLLYTMELFYFCLVGLIEAHLTSKSGTIDTLLAAKRGKSPAAAGGSYLPEAGMRSVGAVWE